MNWQKFDASLASALGDVGDPDVPQFSVFIQTKEAPGPSESDYLEELGVSSGNKRERQVFVGTLSARAISRLSEQSWVRSVRLSRNLQLASGG
jgi:hypothetical protein